jgi:hypothetical protein
MLNDREKYDMTFEECEQNRRDPQWGHPVLNLAVHASHWIGSAIALHPDRREELEALAVRLEEVTGDLGREGEQEIFTGIETEGEIIVALEEIVAIMRHLAPLLVDRSSTT